MTVVKGLDPLGRIQNQSPNQQYEQISRTG